MFKSLTSCIDWFLAFFKLRHSSLYKNILVRLLLNDVLDHSRFRLSKPQTVLKRAYWIYLAIKAFLYSSENKNYLPPDCKNIYFVIASSDKWILRGLANDLCDELNQLQRIINYSVVSIESLSEFEESSHYIAMHQSLGVRLLNNRGLKSNQVSIYYTHSRLLTPKLTNIYNKCYRVFFQSPIDLNLMISNQLRTDKSILLPIGFSPQLFNCIDPISPENKKFDFILSLPFQRRYENIHYYDRKNLHELERIVFHLSKNYNILILGSKWENSFFGKSPNITYMDIHYTDKPKYYRQANTFLCLSRLEGGPIPLLEALATGCNVITTNVGFSSMIRSCSQRIHILSSLSATPSATADYIAGIYDETFRYAPVSDLNSLSSKTLLENHSFATMARLIHAQYL